MHFIEDFKDFILQNVPTSELWAESIATCLISTMVTRDRFIRTSLGKLRLNTWFLMIGPSGLAAKTTPMSSMVFPILAEVTQKINYPVIMPNRFSVEGFIEWLSKDHPWGCIIRDEASSLFKDAGKEYLADMIEFMSEIYDGAAQKRFTRKAKLEEAQSTYVSFMGATTPYLYRIMKPEFFMQGTGNRLMYILHEPSRSHEMSLEDVFLDQNRSLEMEEKMHEYAEALTNVFENPIESLMPEPEAGTKWLQFRKKCFDKAQRMYQNDFLDIRYSYITRLPEFSLKLSGLYEMSKMIDHLRHFPSTEFPITEDSMDWGIQKVQKHHQSFEKMLSQWFNIPEQGTIVTISQQAKLFLDHVKREREKGILWSDLYKTLMWHKNQFKSVIHSLILTGDLIVIKKPKQKGVKLFHKKFTTQATLQGDRAVGVDLALMWLNLNR